MVKMSTFNDPLFSSTHKAQNEFLMLSMYAAASLYADHAKTRDAGVMYFSSAKQLLGLSLQFLSSSVPDTYSRSTGAFGHCLSGTDIACVLRSCNR